MFGRKTCGEILRQIVAIFLYQHRFHLQGFDGFHSGDVLGDEGLVLGPQHELFVEAFPQGGCDQQAGQGDQRHQQQGDEAQLPAVPEHDSEED